MNGYLNAGIELLKRNNKIATFNKVFENDRLSSIDRYLERVVN